MNLPMTPEHLQLLSDQQLVDAAEQRSKSPAPDDARAALSRMARYELRRRQCDVPVRDRYDSDERFTRS